MVAERSNSKSFYQLNKMPDSLFTPSGKVGKNKQKILEHKKTKKSIAFQGQTQVARGDTSTKKLHS